MSDRFDELRWRWRMLVLELLVHVADEVRGIRQSMAGEWGGLDSLMRERRNDLKARAEQLRAEVER